jgi:hypothetical protein
MALLLTVLSSTVFLLSLGTWASAQDNRVDTAPPPLKILSKSERSRLDAENDVKSHTKLALDLMQERLAAAEKLNSAEDYESMFRELGAFNALIDECLRFLGRRDTGSDKILNNYKRLEIGLRAFVPRLESIRRELPLRYEEYVRKLMKEVRDARAKAIDPMFADPVLGNEDNQDQ